MKINHISVSRHQTHKECPQKYKFVYHLEVVPKGPEPIYFTYGKIVHKIAEIYVKNKGALDINEITNDVLKNGLGLESKFENQRPPTPLTSEYKKKLIQHVKVIKHNADTIGYDGEIEWPFYYDLDPPNNKMVKGFIDRLIIRNGKYFILDYKTSKKNNYRKTASTIREDLQLRMYARIVQKVFNVSETDIKAALLYLEGNELVSTNFTLNSLESAERELLYSYNEIKEKDPDEVWGKVGDHCSRCDYLDQCPFVNQHLRT